MADPLVAGNLIKATGLHGAEDAGIAVTGTGQLVVAAGGFALSSKKIGDPGTTIAVVEVNNIPNISIDPGMVCNLVAVGSGSNGGVYNNGGGHGGPQFWLHSGGGINVEVYDYATDATALMADYTNSIWVGAFDSLSYTGINYSTGSSYISDVHLLVRANAGHKRWYGTSLVDGTYLGRPFVSAGGGFGKAGYVPASTGGVIYDVTGTTATTSTNGTFDTLFTRSVVGGTFQNTGDTVRGRFVFKLIGSATATRQVRVNFAGSAIFDTGSVTTASTCQIVVEYEIMMISPTSVAYSATVIGPGMSAVVGPSAGTLTGLTLTGANALTATAAAAGTGAAGGDISILAPGKVDWKPAAIAPAFPLNYNPLCYHTADAGAYQTGSLSSPCNGDGQAVQLLLDQTGNGLHLWSPNFGNGTSVQPSYQTNVQNGLPGILFNGVDDYMFLWLNIFGSIPQPYTVYMVVRTGSAGSGQTNFMGINDGAGGGVCWASFNQLFLAASGTQTGLGPTLNNNTAHVICGVFNGASSKWNADGGTYSTGTIGAAAVGGQIRIGAALLGNPASAYAQFYLLAWMILPYIPTTDQDTAIQDGFKAKWGTP